MSPRRRMDQGSSRSDARYKLVLFDIDGTITTHRSSWQYLHEVLNIWDNKASIYQQKFLEGKISYREFCLLDAAHWRGMPESRLRSLFRNVPYSKNAPLAIKTLKEMGLKLCAFSTGLQFIPERIQADLGFDYLLFNKLLMRNGLATGGVKINISHNAKARVLAKALKRFDVKPSQVISVGDSDGDIPLADHQ